MEKITQRRHTSAAADWDAADHLVEGGETDVGGSRPYSYKLEEGGAARPVPGCGYSGLK